MVGDLFSTLALAELPPTAKSLDTLPENTLADVEAKREAWERAQLAYAQAPARLLADLFCAAFFAPKTTINWERVPTNEDLVRLRAGQPPRPGVVELTRQLAETFNFFHWHLAFPEVLAAGGFDVVLANPPWEVSQLSEDEFFASRLPELSALAGATRKRAIELLETEQPGLWEEFRKAKRGFETSNAFIRESDRYPLTATGKLNLYALFAEGAAELVGERGRAGIVVPTGIATDDSTKAFFSAIATTGRLASLYDFENREKLFAAVDSRMKYCLLTLGRQEAARFVFFATQTDHLRDDRRAFSLSAADITLLNPNTKTCPVFRSQADAELTKKIYHRIPVLIDESGGADCNPWGIVFRQGLFNMTSDSDLFQTAAQLEAGGAERSGANWVDLDKRVWVRLYEAKMINFFDHRAGSYESRGDARGYRVLPDTPLRSYEDAGWLSTPFYWVVDDEVESRLGHTWTRKWLLGFKDVTSATNERTVIASLFPRVGVGHTLPIIFPKGEHPAHVVMALLANLNSLPLDYVARQKVGGLHLTFGYVRQFPVLPPDQYGSGELEFIVARVLELTYTAHDLAPFARDLGYSGPPFAWDPDRRALLRAELDAYYARLYGLTRDELRYILDPADVYGDDYPSETFRVLKNNEMRHFGEYRTRRLVLEAWDRANS